MIDDTLFNQDDFLPSFYPSKLVCDFTGKPFIEVDEKNKLFKISNDLFDFKSLDSYRLLQDEKEYEKENLFKDDSDMSLDFLSAVFKNKENKESCKSLNLEVVLNSAKSDKVYIKFITAETKIGSFIYIDALEAAKKCILLLDDIKPDN